MAWYEASFRVLNVSAHEEVLAYVQRNACREGSTSGLVSGELWY